MINNQSLLESTERPPIFDAIDRDIHRCYPSNIDLILAHSMFSEAGGQGFDVLLMVDSETFVIFYKLTHCIIQFWVTVREWG